MGSDVPAGRLERNIRDLARWRVIFGLLFVTLPLGLYGLFERQARRLDALGDHGATAMATVTKVTRQGSATYVHYAFEVGSQQYSWSVGHEDAPFPMGATFPVTFLPEDPTLSRPGSDRSRGSREAQRNRAFSFKTVSVLALFFGMCAFACDFKLRRLRRHGEAELDDPRGYRIRLLFGGAMLLPFLVLIFGWHAKDAQARGESFVPVVLGVVLSLGILGGTAFYVLRHGRERVAARSARIIKWAAPFAAGIAALRLLAWLLWRQ
ncbi:MAG: hypothetical protein R3B13_39450 [Polyangiaceae bacterium]